MTAAALLTQLSGLGVSAWADGAVLRFKPASLIPPDVLADMRAHKAELLALLAAPIVAAAAPPSAFTLALFPADRGYLARQPVQVVPATAPSPAVAALGGTGEALAAAVAALRVEAATGDALPMPHWPPGSWRKRRYASDTPGALWTTLQRPVSWADPDARPTAGDWCGCCEGARWWRRTARTDGGWCCSTCHPPSGLAASDIEEVGMTAMIALPPPPQARGSFRAALQRGGIQPWGNASQAVGTLSARIADPGAGA